MPDNYLPYLLHVRDWDDDITKYARILRGESDLPRRGCHCTTCNSAKEIRDLLPEELITLERAR